MGRDRGSGKGSEFNRFAGDRRQPPGCIHRQAAADFAEKASLRRQDFFRYWNLEQAKKVKPSLMIQS